uniref:Uncharacterized protein n=1 Tax=Meloidogyne javanica TaxID=6303 RepID=A0A915MKU4_MELJA
MLRISPQQRPTSCQLLDQVRHLCSSKEKKNSKINGNYFDKNVFDGINSFSALYAFDIALSESHQLLLTMQGQVYSWGDNSFGQLGHGDKRKRQFPTLIELLESKDVYKVAAGKKFSLFCAGRGILLSAGRKLLFDNSDYLTKPKIVEELLTFETGEVYVWGKGKNGQLGTGNRNNVSVPIRIQIPTRQLIKRIMYVYLKNYI